MSCQAAGIDFSPPATLNWIRIRTWTHGWMTSDLRHVANQDDPLKFKPTNTVSRKSDLSAFESDVVAHAGWDDLSISCLLKTVDLLVYYLHFPHISRLYRDWCTIHTET